VREGGGLETSLTATQALLKDEARHADVVARGTVQCFYLEKRVFNELLGPLQDIMLRQPYFKEEETASPKKDGTVDITRVLVPAKREMPFPLEEIERLRTIGLGTFGRVYLVRQREHEEYVR
jgi:hypothetical protein